MKTCLVVEDNEIISGIVLEILADLGVNAIEKNTAIEAVAVCEGQTIDIVLLDWDLPSLAALDFLRGAAALPEEKRPIIVLCATENDHQQFTLAKAAGAEHVLLKPFNKVMLSSKLASIGIIEKPNNADINDDINGGAHKSASINARA